VDCFEVLLWSVVECCGGGLCSECYEVSVME